MRKKGQIDIHIQTDMETEKGKDRDRLKLGQHKRDLKNAGFHAKVIIRQSEITEQFW